MIRPGQVKGKAVQDMAIIGLDTKMGRTHWHYLVT
jgi:hypothetical protein